MGMSVRHAFILFAFVFALGGQTSALAQEGYVIGCVANVLNMIGYSSETLSSKLTQLPKLKSMVLNMMEDPSIPGNIKRILKRALQDNDTTVFNLTQEVRAKYKVPTYFDAAHHSKGLKFHTFSALEEEGMIVQQAVPQSGTSGVNPPVTKTLNQKGQDEMVGLAKLGKHTVFVQERDITTDVNDLITLVHELSHVRFDAFLEANIDKIAERFPVSLIKETEAGSGKFEINRQLYDFLSERYAFQTERSVLTAAYGQYFQSYYYRYWDMQGWSEDTVRAAISEKIIRKYKISDPEVVALKDRTISNILEKGVQKKQ